MNRLLIISTLIVLTSCGQSTQSDNSVNQVEKHRNTPTESETTKTDQKNEKGEKIANFDCTDFDFNSAKERSDSLVESMEKAKNSDSTERQKWERRFFCAFPNSFEEMQSVFGYDNEKGAAPLYHYPKGENVIQYFSQLESIPDSIYYDKYVKININGVWEADNIREAFDFGSKLIDDTENASKILSKLSDSEVKSVFRFIFDGPHPKNEINENFYEKLKPKIERQDKRLGRLLIQAYNELMTVDDGHGH